MTEEKKQKLAARIVDELMIPEVQAMVEDARKAGRAEANEQIRLALFHLDEDDPVRANIARAREILLGVIGAEPAQDDEKPEVRDGALKLEPCPHCGSHISVALVSSEDEDYDGDDPSGASHHVVCNVHVGGCGASGGYHLSIFDAIEAWNRRPSSEPSHG